MLRRMPIWSAGFQGMPLALAANIVPPSLPVAATRRMIASQLQPLLENISHPRYVRGRVRLLWPNVSSSEREDRESELLIFLMTLPKKSKFRALGYNGFPKGCKDRVQTFSPEHAHGASEPRFFHYIKKILTNHFTSLSEKASLNPVQRYNTLSLYSLDRDGTLIEAYIYAFTREGGASEMNYDQSMENSILADKFVSFVKTHNPELLEVMNTIQMTDTFVEAKHAVGFPERLFIRARNRLAVLYSCFDKGTDPPRQRRSTVLGPREQSKFGSLKSTCGWPCFRQSEKERIAEPFLSSFALETYLSNDNSLSAIKIQSPPPSSVERVVWTFQLCGNRTFLLCRDTDI